jgi:hypothetical protein
MRRLAPLIQQHVPQVTPVLQGRPHAGVSPRSQVDVVVSQDRHDLGDLLTNILGDRISLSEVVYKTAVSTLGGHGVIVAESAISVMSPECFNASS